MSSNAANNPALLLISLFWPWMAFAQTVADELPEVYPDSRLIREHAIRSLTVYADFSENGIAAHGGFGGKIAEIEFDTNGYQTYKLVSRNGGNLPFIEYGRGSTISIDSSDQNGRKLSSYFENFRYTTQTLQEYDPDGNVLSETVIIDGDTLAKTGFDWSDGKLVRSTVLYADASNSTTVNRFDEAGRLTTHASGNLRQEYGYENRGDTLVTTVKTYLEDTLRYTEVSVSDPSGRVTRYTRRDRSGNPEIEMEAQFDEAGNAVFYLFDDQQAPQEERTAPIRVKIENTYNSQGLLVKRAYYSAEAGTNVLTRIDRYFYDTEPLPYKREKGMFARQRAIEEEYYDR